MIISEISLTDQPPIISDRMDMFLQEIGILFDTNKREVCGDIDFGSDFEKFIWNLNVSNTEISDYVLVLINNIYLSRYFYINVDTTIIDGEISDIILVHVKIEDVETGDKYENIYKVQ